MSLQYKIEKNIEPDNRGWIVDKITCLDGENVLGYIKIENMPLGNFKKNFPTVFHYLYLIEGHGYFSYDNAFKPLNELSLGCLHNVLSHYYSTIWVREKNYPDTTDECLKLIQEYNKKLKRNNKQYNHFIDYVVDKPRVAYSFVEKHHRNKGIGLSLYLKAKEYLNQQGYDFYASGLQTEYAKKMWNKLDSLGYVKISKKGYKYI